MTNSDRVIAIAVRLWVHLLGLFLGPSSNRWLTDKSLAT
jgi:hypothetical protein